MKNWAEIMKTDTQIIIASTLFVLVFAMVSRLMLGRLPVSAAQESYGSWACTADVYVCPDGSEAWRVPPYCLFASCPTR